MVLAKRDEDETGIRPAFCYSGAAPHGNWRTPASSLIHDLPLGKKMCFAKNNQLFFFFLKDGNAFQSNLLPCLYPDIPRSGKLLSGDKSICTMGTTAPVVGIPNASLPVEAAAGGTLFCHQSVGTLGPIVTSALSPRNARMLAGNARDTILGMERNHQ